MRTCLEEDEDVVYVVRELLNPPGLFPGFTAKTAPELRIVEEFLQLLVPFLPVPHVSHPVRQASHLHLGQNEWNDPPGQLGRVSLASLPNHTPHLAWIGPGTPRADKVFSPEEAFRLLAGEVTVEEKVDGAKVGFFMDAEGNLRAQNRGEYLQHGAHPQFQPLWPWLEARRSALIEALGPSLVLFGEWCFAVHSIQYRSLPDWFLGFDVYDREVDRFWSTGRRDALLGQLGLAGVPRLGQDRFTLPQLCAMMGPSRLGADAMEGLYVRRENELWLEGRAKLVRAEFNQAIEEHWSARQLQKNRLASR